MQWKDCTSGAKRLLKRQHCKPKLWGGNVNYFEKTVDFVQLVKVKGNVKTNLSGKVEFMVCDEEKCLPPSEVEVKVNIGG